LAIAFTWPLAAHLTSVLAGRDDNWQNLWNFVEVSRALGRLSSPFFTHDVWHPDGVTLVFQTFDLPDATLASLLMPLVGPLAAFNLVYLWIFVSCGAAMYLLARDRGGSRMAAFLAGGAYTFTTFHFAHANHVHILAMQWVPLYLLALLRVLDGDRWIWAFAGGVALVLTSLASWYHLLGAFLVTLPILGSWILGDRARWRIIVPRVLGLCATYLVLIGPLLLAILRARAQDPVAGAHPAQWFSADLQSFVFPNAAQTLHRFSAHWKRWQGGAEETASYLGLVLLLTCLIGWRLRANRVGVWLAAAAVGIVMSLGPALHVGGRVVTGQVLPYAWAAHAFPLLSFMGAPVRFGFAATLGLAAALAPSLDAIAARWGWRVALPLGLLTFPEHLPNPFAVSVPVTPAPMREWARAQEPFAVLDATQAETRRLWHQVVHGKPIFGGYLTRTPLRLERKLAADPIAGPLLAWEPPTAVVPFGTSPPDWRAAREPIAQQSPPLSLSDHLNGTLVVHAAGKWFFQLWSEDEGQLFIDGKPVLESRAGTEGHWMSAVIELAKGNHTVEVHYAKRGGCPRLRGWARPPGGDVDWLGTTDIPGGLSGQVQVRRVTLTRDSALAHMHPLHVGYIVASLEDSACLLERQLGFVPMYSGEGVRIYQVPTH